LRKCFGVSWQAAALVFVLFQLNGFLLFRIAIGHLTYHIFGLIPVLSWLVLLPTAAEDGSVQINFIRSIGQIIAGAVVLAMVVYAGATNFIIPVVLSVVAVLLVHQARIGWRLAPWCTLAGACLWAIPLSAIKLFPAFIFVRGYPRPYLLDFLFADPIRLFKVLAGCLLPKFFHRLSVRSGVPPSGWGSTNLNLAYRSFHFYSSWQQFSHSRSSRRGRDISSFGSASDSSWRFQWR